MKNLGRRSQAYRHVSRMQPVVANIKPGPSNVHSSVSNLAVLPRQLVFSTRSKYELLSRFLFRSTSRPSLDLASLEILPSMTSPLTATAVSVSKMLPTLIKSQLDKVQENPGEYFPLATENKKRALSPHKRIRQEVKWVLSIYKTMAVFQELH